MLLKIFSNLNIQHKVVNVGYYRNHMVGEINDLFLHICEEKKAEKENGNSS